MSASAPQSVRSLRHFNERTYKTQICDTWRKTGVCKYGSMCLFAHGKKELRVLGNGRPLLQRKKQCVPVMPPPPRGPESPPPERPRVYPPLPPEPPRVYTPLPPEPPRVYPPLPLRPPPSPSLHSLAETHKTHKYTLRHSSLPLTDWSSLVQTVHVLHQTLHKSLPLQKNVPPPQNVSPPSLHPSLPLTDWSSLIQTVQVLHQTLHKPPRADTWRGI